MDGLLKIALKIIRNEVTSHSAGGGMSGRIKLFEVPMKSGTSFLCETEMKNNFSNFQSALTFLILFVSRQKVYN
jgi:hypothetical protein